MTLGDKSKLIKSIGTDIKFGVVLVDVIITLYVLWLIITDTSTWIVGVLLGYTPFGVIQLFRASKLYGLCIYHKLMLVHTTLVYACCVYQAQYGFGQNLIFMRWLMFLLGFSLILGLMFNLLINTHNNDHY